MITPPRSFLLCAAAVALFAAPPVAGTNVAVFNFQMKSKTPDWIWLEKGLADRITTDFSRSRKITVTARDETEAPTRTGIAGLPAATATVGIARTPAP